MSKFEDPLAWIGLLFTLCLLWGLYRVHRDDDNSYHIHDLVTTGKYMDLSKVGQLVSLLASTWVFIHMELRGATVEWYAGLYMAAWVGAGFASLYAKLKNTSTNRPDAAPGTQIPPGGSSDTRPPRL